MIVGLYTLDLYCDNYNVIPGGLKDSFGHCYNEFPHTYTHELGSVCRRLARKDGWIIGKRVLCPKCSGRSITK